MTPDQRKRFKVMCADEGLSYADMIDQWMTRHEAKMTRERRAQAHPLHQPVRKSNYPGGGV
jgi:hypothetical protein